MPESAQDVRTTARYAQDDNEFLGTNLKCATVHDPNKQQLTRHPKTYLYVIPAQAGIHFDRATVLRRKPST